ncbi:hypothetical protein Pint_12186 [Pistacia integerrima]|uniref:Uncharacterized protein n=1 Tax=Pistacia integerrima TaxID=434235 RepID=A0ACC0XI62_9ROSI|nr:hypothetical protein Pint_12186 [Pistacia integerrima]
MAERYVNSVPADPQIVVHHLTQNMTQNGTSTHHNYEQRRPSLHLLSRENKNLYLGNCVPLSKAAIKAARARQTSFVEELIKLMKSEDLTLLDQKGNTALCFAAAAGAIEIARIMLKKNPSLLTIRGGENMMPVFMAARLAKGEMASFLYDELSQAKHVFKWEDEVALFFTCLTTSLYGKIYIPTQFFSSH